MMMWWGKEQRDKQFDDKGVFDAREDLFFVADVLLLL